MTIRALVLTLISVIAFTSACGDSATPPTAIEPPSIFLLVVSPVRDPDEKSEIVLDRIDRIAIVAIRPPTGGPIELRMEDRTDPRSSVTNLTGEELLVGLFRDDHLVSEVPLVTGDIWYFANGE